jgi:hypothetical protein
LALDEIVLEGARRMLAVALQAEVDARLSNDPRPIRKPPRDQPAKPIHRS